MALTGGYKQEFKGRFNPQSRDERAEPAEQKTETAGDRKTRVAKEREELLQQIRTDYSFCLGYWRANRDAAADDMSFVAGKFWTAEEKQKRAGRPCIEPDEISQYIKQCTNNFRQNKREGKVMPKGEGATDQDAERREAIIRGIQYASSANAAHTTGFEAAVKSGMGFWGVLTKRIPNGKGMSVEPRIRRIPNQFTVLLDPEAREADFSDQNICFVTDVYRKSTFAEKFPNAEKTSFNVEDEKLAPDWFKGDSIVVAEYWKRTSKTRTKMKLRTPEGSVGVYDDDLKEEPKDDDVLAAEEETTHTVTQYITNGIEIIDEIEWPGSWIPVIAVVGEEIYEAEQDGESKRTFLSLTRRMKQPQKMLAFIASQEAEEFSMAPRSPLLIWEGQETADKVALENLNTRPTPFVRLKRTPGPDGETVADLPGGGRLPFQPNAQAYEVAREAWRRSIQAAAGITPLPTSAQRQNEKSGIALEKIQDQEAAGSYHFTDNMDLALEFEVRILNELITVIMDVPRTMLARNPDGSHSPVTVGAQEHMQQFTDTPVDPNAPDAGPDYLISDRGEFGETVTTGPNYDSQRQDASAFADHLLEVLPTLGLGPQILAKMMALAIKLKDIGHLGDEMAKIIDPEDDKGQQLQQMQQQVGQMQEQAGALAAEVQQLKLKLAGKVIETQGKKELAVMDHVSRMAEADKDRETKLGVAEVTTKAQSEDERMAIITDLMAQFHQQAHELGQMFQQHQHDRNMAAQNAQHAQDAAVTTAALQPPPASSGVSPSPADQPAG